jgi:hypothetical protein
MTLQQFAILPPHDLKPRRAATSCNPTPFSSEYRPNHRQRDIRSLVRPAEIEMKIKIDPSVIGQARWYEYPVRFLFGGTITAAAGIIAKKFGAGIGGLFLAFPAISPPAQR